MAKIIQAEARVTAVDATGETFAAIAAKVKGLESSFRALGRGIGGGIGGVNKTISNLHHAITTMAPLAAGTGAMEGVRGIQSVIHEAVRATAERVHEQIRMELAGMPPPERAEADRLSLELSERFKSISQPDVLHLLRNMRAIVGGYEEAAKLLDPILKLRMTVLAAHPEMVAQLDESLDKLMKSQEILGITQDPDRYKKDMGLLGQAMALYGDTLKPDDWFAYAQHSRLAGQGFSDEFLYGVGGTLMQHMGPGQAGTAQSSLFQALIGGHTTLPAMKMLMKMGLIDPKKVEFTRAGLPKRMMPGALTHGDLFKENQYEWMKQVFLPALAAHGIKTKEQFEDVAAILASNRTAGQLLSILATQGPNIEKDIRLLHLAPGLDKQAEIASRDPFVAWIGVTDQFRNLLMIAGGPLAEPAAAGMNRIAAGIVALENATKDHPWAATGIVGGGLAGVGAGVLAGSLWALRGVVGIGRSVLSGGASTAEDLSAEAAIKMMQAAQAAGGATSTLGSAFTSMALRYGAGPLGALLGSTEPAGAGEDAYIREHPEIFGPRPAMLPAGLQPASQKPEVHGDAALSVNVEIEPSDNFISRFISAFRNEINVFARTEPGTGVGTAGSTGLSMPQAGPAP